jgi:hypothetical protein
VRSSTSETEHCRSWSQYGNCEIASNEAPDGSPPAGVYEDLAGIIRQIDSQATVLNGMLAFLLLLAPCM